MNVLVFAVGEKQQIYLLCCKKAEFLFLDVEFYPPHVHILLYEVVNFFASAGFCAEFCRAKVT